MARQRVDQLLVDRGLAESRARAQALILAGLVYAGERKVAKAGEALAGDVALEVRGRDHPWVSRGGLKLDHALAHFGWDVSDAVAMDVGSSTGGFTDVLLARGVARVYAVDVGTNQLAWKLRQDDRVIVHERTNARALTEAQIPEPIALIVCDASFIGLAKVLDRPLDFAGPSARLVALVKPQFEAGRSEVGKGGVVRDPAVHARVCDAAAAWVEGRGWRVEGIVPSPITGPEGNVEFLLAAACNPPVVGEIAPPLQPPLAPPYYPHTDQEPSMQSENKIFEDFAKMANGFAGTMAGMAREGQDGAREKLRDWLGTADAVSREEFEAVKAMAAAARDEAAALRARLDALEAAGKDTGSVPTSDDPQA